jgi:hypothetical protein
MKPDNPIENDPALTKMLREWQINEPLPPRFREQVWQRIARKEAEVPEALWTILANSIAGLMLRRSLALSYITVLLLVGLFAGYMQARADSARLSDELGTRYVQMLDPYQAQHH